MTEEAYGTETKIIVMDFTGGAEIYDGLGDKLAGLDIGVLGELRLNETVRYVELFLLVIGLDNLILNFTVKTL